MNLLAATLPLEIVPPILVGMLAVYLLLPREQPYPRLIGIAAALTALVLGGFALVPNTSHGHVVESILFYIFSALALAGGVSLVTQRNPARGAVSFALVVLSTCGLFLLQAAPFLMAGTIIVYAGAIVVTFLFVIMLCQQHAPSNADGRTREPLLACIVGGLLLAIFIVAIRQQYDGTGFDDVVAATAQAEKSAATGKIQLDALRGAISRLSPSANAVAIARHFEDLESQIVESRARNDQAAAALATFRDRVVTEQANIGTLRPPEQVVLSSFAGPPANRVIDKRLPAGNVVALGRALFSDYLLGVELAGTLLLVATIGAIAITHRNASRRVA